MISKHNKWQRNSYRQIEYNSRYLFFFNSTKIKPLSIYIKNNENNRNINNKKISIYKNAKNILEIVKDISIKFKLLIFNIQPFDLRHQQIYIYVSRKNKYGVKKNNIYSVGLINKNNAKQDKSFHKNCSKNIIFK